jgi:hypothetical protein
VSAHGVLSSHAYPSLVRGKRAREVALEQLGGRSAVRAISMEADPMHVGGYLEENSCRR